jgi:hypothetical protein
MPVSILTRSFFLGLAATAALQLTSSAQGTGVPVSSGSRPHIAILDGYEQRVFTRGINGHVFALEDTEQSWSGSWSAVDVTDLTNAPLAIGNPSAVIATNAGVFRTGTGQIYEVAGQGGKWMKTNLTAITHAPAAESDPVGIVVDGVRSIVYRGPNGNLYEIHRNNDQWNAPWSVVSPSAIANAPPAAGTPIVFNRHYNIPTIYYRGTDFHIYELRRQNGVWSSTNLTASAGAPIPAGLPHPYSRKGDDAVLYRGANGHVYELRRSNLSWSVADLTAITGAPLPAGNPIGYMRLQGYLLEYSIVLFRTHNGHIYELAWHVAGNQNWIVSDLTADLNAAPAASDPTVIAFYGIDQNKIVYRATNGKLHEMWLPEICCPYYWSTGQMYFGPLNP